MRISIPILIAAVAFPAAALAASPLDGAGLPGANRYERCLYLAGRNPQAALDAARGWRDGGGGVPAGHCVAVALFNLKHYGEAALEFDALAHYETAGEAGTRAALLDQAGNAWLLAGKPDNAQTSFSGALDLTPGDPDILADRARAHAMKRDWAGAVVDLSTALSRDPSRPDLLVLRASALRALNRPAEALADIQRALRIRPDYGQALVERGVMKFDAGDTAGARADWNTVIHQSPGSGAAASARAHIQQLGPDTGRD